MICPYCKHSDTKVVDKRESDELSSRRRRECLSCSQRFTTYERIELVEIKVVKSDGRREPYNPEKIRASIEVAIPKRPVTQKQVEDSLEEIDAEVRGKQSREVSSKLIGELVMEKLQGLDQVAFIRYASVYRSFNSPESFESAVEELKDQP